MVDVSTHYMDRLRNQWQGGHNPFTSGLVQSPGVGAVLIDTGPLTDGAHLFQVIVWADTTTCVVIQHRVVGNGASDIDPNGNPIEIPLDIVANVGAGGSNQYTFGDKETFTVGERLRVILGTVATIGVNAPSPANFKGMIRQLSVAESPT